MYLSYYWHVLTKLFIIPSSSDLHFLLQNYTDIVTDISQRKDIDIKDLNNWL